MSYIEKFHDFLTKYLVCPCKIFSNAPANLSKSQKNIHCVQVKNSAGSQTTWTAQDIDGGKHFVLASFK